MLKKATVIFFALVSLFAICAVPVSAAVVKDEYDSGNVYIQDWLGDGFSIMDLHESISLKNNSNYYSYTPNVALNEWNLYNFRIPTEDITLVAGDEFYLVFHFDFLSSLGFLYVHLDFDLLQGDYDDFVVGRSCVPSLPANGFPSLKRQDFTYTIKITARNSVTFEDIRFGYELYRGRTDANYMQIFKSSYYRLYGSNPSLMAQKETNEKLDELNDKQAETNEKLDDLNDKQDDTNEKLDDLGDKQDDTNNKLDDILDQPEQEKNEANSTGNDGVGELTDVIPNHSSGFISGMSNLVTSLSYSGTDCKWEFPQLYIPAMNGVSEKIPLTDSELEIDIGGWVKKLPSTILSVIRILLTIALIVYCVKELYDTIQYALTLRSGGAA